MASTSAQQRGWTFGQTAFVVLMLALTALFVWLGAWQVQRLGEKQALVATVEERFAAPPQAFPALDAGNALDPEALDYRPYELTGRYVPTEPVLIFTNLDEPSGPIGGVGYWVMAPFELEAGGLVWVNRGFVPQDVAASYTNPLDPEPQTVVGVARRPEQTGMFTPAPDLAERREWVRNPERLMAFLDEVDGPVAPVTIDLRAGEAGELPQAGETRITFPNRHLEYAGTWFLFAAITPLMLGFWLWRQRRPGNLAHRSVGH